MSIIDEFLNEVQNNQIEIHSCIIKKGETLLCEETAMPYTLDQPQMLFSISKSFVSLAIGYLVEEKQLRLDEEILTFFPEYYLKASEELRQMKILHLLTMTSGSFEEQRIFSENNWFDAYFKQTFAHMPGQVFHYNNIDIYILSVIVTKLTGVSCNEYLYQKLFMPLEIEMPHWDVCKLGYNTGGWGLYLSPRDLSKIADALIAKNPILPLTYLEKMTTKKVTTQHQTKEYDQGYGYLCWMNPNGEGARFDGIFGQLLLFSFTKQTYMVITANCLNTSNLYPLVFSLWHRLLNEEVEPSKGSLSIFKLPIGMESGRLNDFVDAAFSLRTNAVSILPIPIRFLEKQIGHADHFKFIVKNHQLLLHWQEHYTTNIIKVGLDEKYRYSKILLYEKQFHVAAVGWFESQSKFMVKIFFLEYPYSRLLEFDLLTPKKILLQFQENPSVIEILDQYGAMLKFTPFTQINSWIVEKSYHLISTSVTALKRK